MDTDLTKHLGWPYVAGFFDGEGCIYYAKRPYGRYVMVHVSQGYKNERSSGVLKRIHGFLLEHNIRARLVNYSDAKGWRIVASSSHSCKTWLTYMIPSLIVKKSKAEGALQFIETITRHNVDMETQKKIIEMRSRNLNIKKIGQALGLRHTTVRFQLQKAHLYVPLKRGAQG